MLVIDLERPERFYYILTRSNWRSWMVWGAWFLTGHGMISGLWLVAGLVRVDWRADRCSPGPRIVFAMLATAYTGFLFAQGLGRDLWQGPHAARRPHRAVGAAGAASLLIATLPMVGGRVAQALLGVDPRGLAARCTCSSCCSRTC